MFSDLALLKLYRIFPYVFISIIKLNYVLSYLTKFYY